MQLSEINEILACPVCHGKLCQMKGELVCRFDKLVFPVRDGVPVMLPEEARPLAEEDACQS